MSKNFVLHQKTLRKNNLMYQYFNTIMKIVVLEYILFRFTILFRLAVTGVLNFTSHETNLTQEKNSSLYTRKNLVRFARITQLKPARALVSSAGTLLTNLVILERARYSNNAQSIE